LFPARRRRDDAEQQIKDKQTACTAREARAVDYHSLNAANGGKNARELVESICSKQNRMIREFFSLKYFPKVVENSTGTAERQPSKTNNAEAPSEGLGTANYLSAFAQK
jgi:hypothetical protein